MEVPIGASNPLTTQPQLVAGASTFSKRYAFCNALGILTSDEDNDGADIKIQSEEIEKANKSLGQCTTEKQLLTTWRKLSKKCRGNKDIIMKAKEIKSFIIDNKK